MHSFFWAAFLIVHLLTSFTFVATDDEGSSHQTKQAKIPKNNLSCYVCDTATDGERCSNLNLGNRSTLVQKCEHEERTCMVKRFSYTTSNENSTSMVRMWSLQRSCTVKCEHGCIIIGERTKLYACTSCCNKTQCNVGKGAAPLVYTPCVVLYILPPILMSFNFIDFGAFPR